MPGLRSILLTAPAVAALCLPIAADAATYCVEKPSCTGLDVTLAGGLTEAAGSPDDDRIEIGAVTLPPASYAYAPAIDAGGLQIVGSGRTATILQNQPASDKPALKVLRGPGGNALKITALGVRLSTSGETFAYAIQTAGVVEDVAVTTAGAVAGNMIAVELQADGVLRSSSVSLQSSGGDPDKRAAVFASSTGVLVDRAVIDAPRGIYAQRNVRITRSRIIARGSSGVSACRSAIRIDNSLVRFRSGGRGIDSLATCGGDVASSADIRQVTLSGDGSAGSVAVACTSVSVDFPCSSTLRGTIVDGAADDFALETSDAGGSTTIQAGNSRVDLANVKKTGTGTTTVKSLGGNTTVDPGFVNPAIGDLRLKQGSSMIDVGPTEAIDPAVESTVDLIGKPRTVNGDGVGTTRRDMGAYEFQPQGLGFSGGEQPDPEPPVDPPADPAPSPAPPGETSPAPDALAPAPPVAPTRGAPAAASSSDTRAPGLSGVQLRVGRRALKVVRRAQRARSALRLVLDERATVSVVVERHVGRRWVRRGTVTRVLDAGTRTIALRSALRRAPAGAYRLRVRATDAAGNRSAQRTVALRIVRR